MLDTVAQTVTILTKTRKSIHTLRKKLVLLITELARATIFLHSRKTHM
jgi:hypothetical protein